MAGRRVWNQRLLMLCLLAGLIVAVGILASIPLYADAVQHRLLQGELTEAGTYRPPFSFLWRYIGTWNGNIDREKTTVLIATHNLAVDMFADRVCLLEDGQIREVIQPQRR